MQDGHAGGKRQLVEVRRRGLGEVEVVRRCAVLVELGGCQRGRQLRELHQRIVDLVGEQLAVQQRAEAIARQRAEEGDITSQPADRSRRVERPAAQLGDDRAVVDR